MDAAERDRIDREDQAAADRLGAELVARAEGEALCGYLEGQPLPEALPHWHTAACYEPEEANRDAAG